MLPTPLCFIAAVTRLLHVSWHCKEVRPHRSSACASTTLFRIDQILPGDGPEQQSKADKTQDEDGGLVVM
jgi:hypothetical protein